MDTARTLRTLQTLYIQKQTNKLKPNVLTEQKRIWNSAILPELGADAPLSSFILDPKSDDVNRIEEWHAEYGDRSPIAANRALTSLKLAFDFAADKKWIPRGANPCKGITRFKEEGRKRFPSTGELERIKDALEYLVRDGRTSATTRDAILMLMLTGCRRNEITRLAWHEGVAGAVGWVDMPDRVLHIHGKTGWKHVPVRDEVFAILERRRIASAGLPWVFPSRSGKALAGVQRAWRLACDYANVNGCCIHSLRHAFGTHGVAAGIGLKAIMGLMGHKDERTALKYQHPSMDQLREELKKLN